MAQRDLKSCANCAGRPLCYQTWTPRADRIVLRQRAAQCRLPYRGRGPETVEVEHHSRGISLKNAVLMSARGKFEWIDFHVVRTNVASDVAASDD